MSGSCVVFYVGQDEEVARALHQAEDFIAGSFSTLAGFLCGTSGSRPSCVVVVDLSQGAGLETALDVFSKNMLLPVIILADAPNVALAVRAMKQGAADFLAKPIRPERLLTSVRGVLSAHEARRRRAQRAGAVRSRFAMLSAREREVVDAVLEGCGNKEIASRLEISPRTVETHRSKAMNKLGARTPADLVRVWLDSKESVNVNMR